MRAHREFDGRAAGLSRATRCSKALLLAAVLPVLAGGCDRAVDAAGAAREAIEELDLGALGQRAPETLRALGERTAEELRAAMDRLSDEESLRRLADDWAPALEKLGRIKDRLGGALPGREALRAALAALREQIGEDETMRRAAEPLLDRLDELLR